MGGLVFCADWSNCLSLRAEFNLCCGVSLVFQDFLSKKFNSIHPTANVIEMSLEWKLK